MKKNNFIVFLVLVLLGFLNSCSNNETPEEIPPVIESTISATVNGQAWTSIPGAAIASINQSSLQNQSTSFIQIAGFNFNQSSISIQFPFSSIGVGTYNFDSDSNGALIYFSPLTSGLYSSSNQTGNFTLNVTSFDLASGKMSGTFSGTVFGQNGASIAITNGKIDKVKVISAGFYSNGSMSLKLNNGNLFTMDNDNNDGKYLMIGQNSVNNNLILYGYNVGLDADSGIYFAQIQKNATVGNYNVLNNSNYSLNVSNKENEAVYVVSSGNITINSNTNNIISGTFNYVASNGTTTKTITNGSFSIRYN
jgi:hypothetical protein